jgi:hypothetical protein
MAWRDLNKALFWCAGNGEVELIKDALVDNKVLEFNGEGGVISKNEHYQNVSYKGYRRDYRHPQINGWSPLHYAAQQGHTNCISVLLDHGFPRNVKDDEGNKIDDLAVMFQHKGMQAWLRQWLPPEERNLIEMKKNRIKRRQEEVEKERMKEIAAWTEDEALRRGYSIKTKVKVYWFDFNEAYDGEIQRFVAEKIIVKVNDSPRLPLTNEQMVSDIIEDIKYQSQVVYDYNEQRKIIKGDRDLSNGIIKLDVEHGRVFCKTGVVILYDGVDEKFHTLDEFYRAVEFAQMDIEDRTMTEIREKERVKRERKEAKEKKKRDREAKKALKKKMKEDQKRMDEEMKAQMANEFDARELAKMKKAYEREKKQRKKERQKQVKDAFLKRK